MALLPNQIFQKIETVVTTPKTTLCYDPSLQASNGALIEDGMAAAADVGAGNNNSIDSIVFPAQRRALQIIERRLRRRKAGAVWGSFSRTTRNAMSDCSVRLDYL